MATTRDTGSDTGRDDVQQDLYADRSETSQGKVFTVTGQDWDSITQGLGDAADERVVVNMGPQHPSTHGVLRLILELEGETVTEARCGIGYLHTGIEKNMEFRTWTQGVTFCTRMDYVAPFSNEAAYVMAVEKLLGIEAPEKAQAIVKEVPNANLVTIRGAGHMSPMEQPQQVNDALRKFVKSLA